MLLRRTSASYLRSHEEESSEFNPRSSDVVAQAEIHLDFKQFGAGSENFSWFQIVARWHDVEVLIDAFATLGHPAAVRLHRAEQLATAVESLTKISD
jgi:hypothetical protein